MCLKFSPEQNGSCNKSGNKLQNNSFWVKKMGSVKAFKYKVTLNLHTCGLTIGLWFLHKVAALTGRAVSGLRFHFTLRAPL